MRDSRSVLLICEASSSIGFGHLSRSLEVYLSFKDSTEHNLLFLPVVQQEVLEDVFKARQIEITKDVILFESWNYKNIINEISKRSIDLVILDTHKEHRELRNYFTQQRFKTISLDYFFENNFPDASINLINHPKIFKSSNNLKGKKIYSGGQFAIIRQEFESLRLPREKLNIKESIENCLIIMGGADPKNKTIEAIEIIKNKFSKTKLNKVDIVIGHLFKKILRDKILASIESYHSNIRIHVSPNHVARLFKNKDLVFCGGGTTLLESMSVGIPTAVLPQSEEEENHAKHYSDKGCCVLINEDLFPPELKNQDYRSSLSINAMQNIDHLGKYRIIEIANGILDEKGS